MTSDMQYTKKSFTNYPPTRVKGKKCFKADCANDPEGCENCCMIQGKWLGYVRKDNV